MQVVTVVQRIVITAERKVYDVSQVRNRLNRITLSNIIDILLYS